MGILAPSADERVKAVAIKDDLLVVDLMDGHAARPHFFLDSHGSLVYVIYVKTLDER